MANKWRGCSNVLWQSNGAWGDPDIIADIDGKTYVFNYWDIEDALWDMFCEDNGYDRAEVENDPSIEDEFDLYCQSSAYDYLEDVVYGGYFDGIEDDEGGNWHTRYESCGSRKKSKKKKIINQGCGGKRKVSKEGRNDLHRYFDDLDERFDFDLEDEFEIYLGADIVPCYVVDSTVFGNGAGLSYTIAIPVGEKDHWQMDEWVERGLEEYFADRTDGSDYTFGINAIEKDDYVYGLPNDVDNYNTYVAEVEVVPFDNIGFDDYGINAGVNESKRRSVKESRMFDLVPQKRDSRKSFYGKAKVVDKGDGEYELYSYDTPVAAVKNGEVIYSDLRKWSATTDRHIREFLAQFCDEC